MQIWRSFYAWFISLFPARGGARRGERGERRPPGPPRSLPITSNLVYWILVQVYHHSRTLSSILYSVLRGGFHWAAGGGARGAVGPFVRALLSRAAGAGRRRTADAGLSRLRPRHPARVVRAALARRNPPTLFVVRPQPWRLTTPPAGAAERVLCMGRATPHRLLHRRFSGPGSVATPGLYVGPGQVAAAPARAACKKQAPRLVEQPGDLVHLCTEKRCHRLTAGASVVSLFILRRHTLAAPPALSVYTISWG